MKHKIVTQVAIMVVVKFENILKFNINKFDVKYGFFIENENF